jgi:hypothetical protein
MFFPAVWGAKVASITCFILLPLWGLAVILFLFSFKPKNQPAWAIFLIRHIVLFVAVVFTIATFWVTPRGYRIENNTLQVLRWGGNVVFNLAEVRDVRLVDQPLQGAYRLAGSDGLGGFLGHFRSDKFGDIRLFLTDTDQAVMIDFSGKKVLISPQHPQDFIKVLSDSIKTH